MTATHSHRLWARLDNRFGAQFTNGQTTAPATPFVYWVQFHITNDGGCEFTVCEPDAPLWGKVPVVHTVIRKFFRKGGTRVWSMSVTTARIVWEMLRRDGWHTTPASAQSGKPVSLLTVDQLQEILKNETAGFR